MEISKMWTLSTAHITSETNDLLKKWAYPSGKGPITVYVKDGGYFIRVPDDFEFENMELPEDLEEIIAFAINCFEWICLDCDGPIDARFPTYEW